MGYFDLNNKNLGTKTQLLRKASLITNYIIALIDGTVNLDGYDYKDDFLETSQQIKRLLCYDTDNPLAFKGDRLNGETIPQPNIQQSLLIKNKEYGSERILHNSSFEESIAIAEQCFCFVHNIHNKPINKIMGDMYFRIDIIVPDEKDDVFDSDSEMAIKRGDCICFLINDLIENHKIEVAKYADFVGNVGFEFIDSMKDRVSKTSKSCLYTLIYKVNTCNMRVDE